MRKMPRQSQKDGEEHTVRYIYRPYITRNGRRVYPRRAKVFRIPIVD